MFFLQHQVVPASSCTGNLPAPSAVVQLLQSRSSRRQAGPKAPSQDHYTSHTFHSCTEFGSTTLSTSPPSHIIGGAICVRGNAGVGTGTPPRRTWSACVSCTLMLRTRSRCDTASPLHRLPVQSWCSRVWMSVVVLHRVANHSVIKLTQCV